MSTPKEPRDSVVRAEPVTAGAVFPRIVTLVVLALFTFRACSDACVAREFNINAGSRVLR